MGDHIHIIKKCIKGDRLSQKALYESYKTKWYMTSLRYGKNVSEAEDILQEGLIRIYRDLHQYDSSKAAFATWSSRVIVNAALRYLQKNRWQSTFSDIEEVQEPAAVGETIYDHLSAKELTHMVQTLPTGYRIVFNMYCIEGYSHKEIASELGISEGTSKSQLSKAKKSLRAVLENQLISISDG